MKKRLALIVGIMGILLLAGNAHAIVVTDGLVSWWKFDETEGTIAEDSQGSNDGTLYNFPSPPTWTSDTAGIGSSGSLDFDGTDDYVDVGNDASLNITGSLTLEAWVNLDDVNKNQGIISKIYNSTYESYLLHYAPTDNKFVFYGSSAGTDWDFGVRGTTTPVINTWYHVVGVLDVAEGTAKIYVNGNPEGTDPTIIAPGYNTANPVTIGTRLNRLYEQFNGCIDEVRIYDRALSDDEISQNYAAMCEMIPEPSALLLLGAGLSGLLAFKRQIS